MFEDEGLGSYFKQVVRDAICDIKSKGSSYCFSQKQVDYIKETFPEIIVANCDGIYRLIDGKFDERKKKDGRGKKNEEKS